MDKNISTIYVSQASGNDNFSGCHIFADNSGKGPFKTINHALSVISEYRKNGKLHPISISLLDDYFLSEPIKVEGINGITIESYKNKKRIIGGIRIENWIYDEFNGKKCLSARIPDGIAADFTDLYISGERAHVTRFPKEGKLRIIDADRALTGSHKSNDHVFASSKWFIVSKKDISGIHNVKDAIIHYDHYWIDEHSPIKSYDKETGRLDMEYSSRFSVSADYKNNPDAAPLYYLTNVPNCFGEPGDWYLDRATRKVYYMPKEITISPDSIEAFAPVTDRLFAISGEDIYLKGLELEVTKGDYASTKRYSFSAPDEKYFASDIQSFCCAPGAISFEKAERCGVIDCEIHGVGIYGIEVLKSCNHIRIERNHIYDVCAGGIIVSGGTIEEDPALAVSDCIISGNRIHSCGKRYLAGCGILVMAANNCEISLNEIYDLEYSGISVGWVWGYKDNATYGNIIRGNHVYDVGKGNLSDLAGIYLLGKQRGTVVSENVVHDVKCYTYGAWGIYLDEGSSFVTVENNLVYGTGRESFYLHYGSHNTVRRNIFIGGKNSTVRIGRKEDHEQVTFDGNLLISSGAAVYGILLTDPERLHTDNNIICDIEGCVPLIYKSRDGILYDINYWQSEFHNDINSKLEDSLDAALKEFGIANINFLSKLGIDVKEIFNIAK